MNEVRSIEMPAANHRGEQSSVNMTAKGCLTRVQHPRGANAGLGSGMLGCAVERRLHARACLGLRCIASARAGGAAARPAWEGASIRVTRAYARPAVQP